MADPYIDDPDLSVGALMTLWPQTIPVFLRYRMLCVGCFVSRFHTVADACLAHDQDRESFMAALRDTLRPG